MTIQSLLRVVAATVLANVLSAPVLAQVTTVGTPTLFSYGADIGSSEVGVRFGGALQARSQTATVAGLAFRPMRVDAGASVSLDARLLGMTRQALYFGGSAWARDGVWTTNSSGQVTSYTHGSGGGVTGSFRVAGRVLATYNQAVSASLSGGGVYPLFTFGIPAIELAGVSVGAGVHVNAIGSYSGGLTFSLRNLVAFPSPPFGLATPRASAQLIADGVVVGGAQASVGVLGVEAWAEAVINVARTHLDANMSARGSLVTGNMAFSIEPVRLLLRLCMRAPVIGTHCRTLYDRAFGGTSGNWTL